MKQLLALVLAAMMLASIGCAWAEGTTEEAVEITFQDLPWGSSQKQVESWAKKKGLVIQNVPFTDVYLDASGKYVTGGMSYIGGKSDKFLRAKNDSSFQIAGYTINQLDFHFTEQDGKMGLYTVVVYVYQPDVQLILAAANSNTSSKEDDQIQAILDDLEQKLITVYGENDMSENDMSENAEFSSFHSQLASMTSYVAADRYRKVGAEDTAVCLTYQLLGKGVLLVYGKTDVYTPAEMSVIPTISIDSFNIGGL